MSRHLPLLLIVSSPSGAGKTTLCNMLLGEFADIRFSVSHTTRQPRPGEIDGKHYHFVGNAEFDQMIEDDLFLEWAQVHGNRYGTARAEIRAAATEGLDLVFDIDYQGARQIKQEYQEAVSVFVLPPSLPDLQQRLRTRGTETPQSLERRFKAALEEISHYDEFDYLLVNDDVDRAYRNGVRAILLAERTRRIRATHLAEDLLR
ncbi:MAG TPA: guanylate kinase [Polyangia bacterium]|nr:guanylate kinase [Polyangia bacterium]